MLISFMDKAMCIRGAVISSLTNIVYTAVYMLVFKGDNSDLVFSSTAIVIFAGIIAVKIVSMLEKHSREDIEYIRQASDKQMEISNSVLDMSEEIGNKIENASGHINSLVEAMNLSNNSSDEIAKSVKLIAEAIESQTYMTSDIQNNLQTTGNRTVQMQSESEHTMKSIDEGKTVLKELENQATATAQINRSTSATTKELTGCVIEVEEILEQF